MEREKVLKISVVIREIGKSINELCFKSYPNNYTEDPNNYTEKPKNYTEALKNYGLTVALVGDKKSVKIYKDI